MFDREKNDYRRLGSIYFYVYLPIVQTIDNSK